MARRGGGAAPYTAANLIASFADKDQMTGAYVRGKLALAGVDESRTPLATWLDMVFAIVAEMSESPGRMIEHLDKKIVIETARAEPDRETWGLLPEHQRHSMNATQPGHIGDGIRRPEG